MHETPSRCRRRGLDVAQRGSYLDRVPGLTRMGRHLWWLGVVALTACGADGSESSAGRGGRGGSSAGTIGATGGSGGSSGSGATSGSGASGAGCSKAADCGKGKTCSITKKCIEEGTCATDGDCTDGETCNGAHACVPGTGCGGEEFKVEPVQANAMIVLDRSCSMKQAGDMSGKSKWQLAIEAISNMTTTFADPIRWGLILFPDLTMPDCEQAPGAPHIPIGDGNVAGINTLLMQALNPSDTLYADGPCVTNIDTAVVQASADPALKDMDRNSYILLITDGVQSDSCRGNKADPDTEAAISALSGLGVGTFVISFGEMVDGPQLDKFAMLGGHPNPDPVTDVYLSTDGPTLQAALDMIASSVIGCEFALATPPENLDELYVFLDDEMVPRDTTKANGWDYDEATKQVAFFGPPCDGLRDGSLTDIDVVFGCPEPTPD